MATSILRSFTFRAEKRIPRSFERLAKRPTRQNRVASYVFPSFIRLRKRLLRLKSARSFQHEEHLRAIGLYSIGVYYSLDVVLLLATGILPEKEPVHFPFHAQREGRRAGVDSAACTATAENGKDPILMRRFFA